MSPSLPASFTFSQTSLQDYADCPRRFQLRYLDRLAYPAMEAEPALEHERRMAEGATFHRMAQQFLVGIPEEKVARQANTPDLARWWKNFTYTKEILGLKSQPALFPEATLSAGLGAFRLAAKYDLIVRAAEGRFLVYDWKTYRKRPRNEALASRWQTRVYRALLVKAGKQLNNGQSIAPEQCEMIYWFSDFPDEPAHFPYTPLQYQRDWDALTRLVEEIQSAADFPKTDDLNQCAYCAYRSYCERGTQAGDLDATEIEPEAEAHFDVDFEQIGEIAF